jgi:hypothetical protein
VIYSYRLSRRDAIARGAYAIAWIVGLLCAAIFIFDGAITRIVLSLFASWLFLGIFFETFEATIDEEGVCEFRSLLRRKQIRAHQVRSISGGPSDDPEESNDIFIRYDRGRVSLPGEDFVGLVQDLLALGRTFFASAVPARALVRLRSRMRYRDLCRVCVMAR